ncbi:Mobile element protein [Candidatus Syntrophocurvum alkaliphilum]|uniref:Mobile element protein n=1 Tax=Candidatus Syntrophocurvum alkaliphilum TaxID=2293317 RepID=A0A6I6DM62_9FIRM|nr:transposase [Candidatus Syntrophocurvum alkaliphilum]QGU00830.1 Mobile element protein [Candidatus Syntrophocurvum alkaliphilum]
MPRQPRVKSESGIYHVMLRGVRKQDIFHDDEDCLRFLTTIKRYKKQSQINVYGWCLMGNHVHLLLKEGNENISTTMKRIGVSYVWFYNQKYKTVGHLFQDRYKSEQIETDEYLLTVIRYIHQNPVKAGFAKTPASWRWSSCFGYYGKEYEPVALLDDQLILGLFAHNQTVARDEFKDFNEIKNDDQCLDDKYIKKLTDEEALQEINKLQLGLDLEAIKKLPKTKRNVIISQIKTIEGLTQRQIARILNISENVIFKA